MSNINSCNIKCRLIEELAKCYDTTTYTVDDVTGLSLSASLIDEANTITVETINDLPDLTYADFPDGMIYFIKQVGYHAFNVGSKWLAFDGSLIINDASGFIWSWGNNVNGQLGDNATTNTSSPISVTGGFDNWKQISAGENSMLALRDDGTLWSWGNNCLGKLGDNTTTNRSSPVSVVGGFTDWIDSSVWNNASFGLRQNGTIWSWGNNTNGQIGDNTTTHRYSPVSVVGGFTDWCQISGGFTSASAIRQNGTIWTWGCNGQGRLGDNTITDRSSPVSVVGGFTDWCQVSAGNSHMSAIRQDGTVWSWGEATNGRLGDNTSVSKSSPVSVVGGFTDWCQVSLGFYHTLALRQNGTLWTWGANFVGQLGDNTITSRSSPISVIGGFTDWCQVSAGGGHSSALRQNGTIWTWGANTQGRLGDGTITSRRSPVSVVGGFTDWCQVSAGGSHVAGIRSC